MNSRRRRVMTRKAQVEHNRSAFSGDCYRGKTHVILLTCLLAMLRALAPVYSITSSARSRIDRGTSRPSALAVLRFTTISNLVGNCTGRSPGFAPRRMRST
jgi:hypothetical protein